MRAVAAVQSGAAMRNPNDPTPRSFDLWWHEDQFHPSGHGAYLSGLVMFGALTGIDPASFSANERAAKALGITALQATQLQWVASQQLSASGYPMTRLNCLAANSAQGAANGCARAAAR